MTDIISGFKEIRDLPTTVVEVVKASHDDPSEAVIKVTRADFNALTGVVKATVSGQVTREGVLIHRARLITEKARIQVAIDDLQAFVAVAQAAIDKWLIDHPKGEK
jgi:hypothetical protein